MTDSDNVIEMVPASKSEFCLTPTAKTIHRYMEICRENQLIGAIIGEPGTGKSAAIKQYTLEHSEAISCRASVPSRNMQPMLVSLCRSLQVEASYHMGAPELTQKLLEELSRYMFESPLLILDEAQKLADDSLEALSDIFDSSRVGIVLVGNASLDERWSLPEGKKRKANPFASLCGRMCEPLHLVNPLQEDIQALCAHHGINSKEALTLIQKVVEMPGQLHKIGQLFRVARTQSGKTNRLSFTSVKEAAAVLGVSS